MPTASGHRAAPTPDRVRERSATRITLPDAAAGVAVEVVDGPMDGLVLAGRFDSLQIGRVARRAGEIFLELYLDSSVSSRHALFTATADPRVWRIEDRDSTNGTLVADEDIRGTGPREIALGSCFMVGHSVLRSLAVTRAAGQETFAPNAEQLRTESARVIGLLAPESAQGYGAAVALAIAEQRPYLTDRHLFLGLAALHPELPIFARGGGPLGPRFLSDALWRNEYFTGPEAWIHRRLRTLSSGVSVLSKDDVTPTPRLLRLLLAAEEEAGAAGAPGILPEDLLRAFLSGPDNRPRELLEREKISLATLGSLLGRGVAPAGRPSPAAGRPVPASAAPAPPAEAPAAPTSGDPALDARAQEAARKLYGVSALYHLAAVEDRRDALRQLLRQELSQLPAEGRPRLLSQLRRLFPLASTAALAALESREAPRRSARPPVATPAPAERPAAPSLALPWSSLLVREGSPDLSSLPPADRAALAFLRDLFVFSIDVENLAVTVVQSSRFSGPGTEQVQLSGFSTSIRRFAKEVAAGKEPRREALEEYLSAIRTWLVATFAAYREAPDLWFKDFWRKVSPTVIEARADAKGLLPGMGHWNRYKEQVKDIRPDLVADEIQQLVQKKAAERFNQVYERRKSS